MRRYLGLVFAGLVFFALPNFNLLDLMPDFIGAILIMCGLSKMYMYDGNFEDARRSAKFLLWISVLRTVLCLWATSGGKRDYLLPFTFIVCVLEAIYMVSLFKGLYLGLEYTLMRAGSERLVKRVNEAFTFSFIFTIASRVLEFAPQICEIYRQDAELDLSSGASFKMSMAQMAMYVLGVCLVCGIILGAIYLFMTCSLWIRVIADKSYAPFLKEKYENYLVDYREEYVAEKTSFIYLLITLSFVFIPDFFIDGINLIPSVIAAVIAYAATVSVSRLGKTSLLVPSVLCVSASVFSVLSYLFMNRVHLGINFLLSSESYNYSYFALLESKTSVYICSLLAISEFVLSAAVIFVCLVRMMRLFGKEKRKAAIPMLKIVTVPSFLALLSASLTKIFKTFEAHLLTNTVVSDYVKNKAYIASSKEYLGYQQNPLISQYERISSTSYILAIATVVLTVICILYLLRIRRVTEGDEVKK